MNDARIKGMGAEAAVHVPEVVVPAADVAAPAVDGCLACQRAVEPSGIAGPLPKVPLLGNPMPQNFLLEGVCLQNFTFCNPLSKPLRHFNLNNISWGLRTLGQVWLQLLHESEPRISMLLPKGMLFPQ